MASTEMHSNPSATITVDCTLPDISQLTVDAQPSTPSPEAEAETEPQSLTAPPRSEENQEEAIHTSAARAPKPDGPKKSDPFQFGSRLLLPGDNPFEFNAWDHVEIDDEYKEYAKEQIAKQRAKPVSDFDKQRFNSNPVKWWDIFYKNNQENFFKDRKWLQQEFPILAAATANGYGPVRVVELGCGAGNTLFPVLQQNSNPQFHIHGCDFSANAVAVVKKQPLYAEHSLKGNVHASVYDLSAPETLPEEVEPESIDIVIMVFVFSALAPDQWIPALRNIRRMLKKGGKVLFRDYGRGDLAQVRFKAGRYLDENFYIRGDGTRVYFFEESQLGEIFTGKFDADSDLPRREAEEDYGGFTVDSLGTDKRMLVNRTKKLKMYRRWLQAAFIKI